MIGRVDHIKRTLRPRWNPKNLRRPIVIIAIGLLLSIILAFCSTTSADTITVDKDGSGDYETITEAVNHAAPGDTIFIRAGTYSERVTIGKQLTIHGIDRNATIISGPGGGTVVRITANNVELQGCGVRNGDIGIGIESDNGTIEECGVSECVDGIDLYQANGNTIRDNYCDGNEIGIHLSQSDENVLTANTCTNNELYGIYIFSSKQNTIEGLQSRNNRYGAFFTGTGPSYNVLEECEFSGNENDGLRVWSSERISILNCTLTENGETGCFLSDDRIDIHGSVFSNQPVGLLISGDQSEISITNSTITGHSNYGIDARLNSGIQISSIHNWWGDLTGPYHPVDNPNGTGDTVSDGVTFDPWLFPDEQDFLENLSIGSPQTILSGEPDEFLNYELTITNNASESYVLSIRDQGADNLSFLFPSGSIIGPIDPGETIDWELSVLISKWTAPGNRTWNISLTSTTNAHLIKTLEFTTIINTIHRINASIISGPAGGIVYPGEAVEYVLRISNVGNIAENVSLDVPIEIEGSQNIPSLWTVETPIVNWTLDMSETAIVTITVDPYQYAPPGQFTITGWFTFNTSLSSTIFQMGGEITTVFKPHLNTEIIDEVVRPSHDGPGLADVRVTLSNEGNVRDRFEYELGMDASTNRYGQWLAMPGEVVLEPGSGLVIEFTLVVPSYLNDSLALANGTIREIRTVVYSVGARENLSEVIGIMTTMLEIRVDIEEYRYAEITSVFPNSILVQEGESYTVNVTFVNLGNAEEQYWFAKDGLNGSGNLVSWYDFNISSIMLDPLEAIQIILTITIPEFTESGIYPLHFHAESSHTFDTPEEIVQVEIERSFSAIFINGQSISSDPGRSVQLRVTVRNSGNTKTSIRLDQVDVPEGWALPNWVDGDIKQIDPYSVELFTLELVIPTKYPDAPQGTYHFPVTGSYLNGSGNWTTIPGNEIVELRVLTVYSLEMEVLDSQPSALPGETVRYQVTIRNNGNRNDTYILAIRGVPGMPNGQFWATLEGDITDDRIPIPMGEARIIHVNVNVPSFTKDNDEALHDTYGILVNAESLSNYQIDATVNLEVDVTRIAGVEIWSEYPERELIHGVHTSKRTTFTVNIRNLGNEDDEFQVLVPVEDMLGEIGNWDIRFGSYTAKIIDLTPIHHESLQLSVIIDPETKPGDYSFRIRATSQFDTDVTEYLTLQIHIINGSYGIVTEKVPLPPIEVNPASKDEIEFQFRLGNSGNELDSYSLTIDTPLFSGTYRDWTIEFENKRLTRLEEISVPTSVSNENATYLQPGEYIYLSIFVMVPLTTNEGIFDNITILITSDSDPLVTEHLSFNLTVILPNIRLSNSPSDFYIDPNLDIEYEEDIQVNIRVFNDGKAPTGEFHLLVYNGKQSSSIDESGQYIQFSTIVNIPAQSYRNVDFIWEDMPIGINDLYAIADKPIRSGVGKTLIGSTFSEWGLVHERDEEDNAVSIDANYREAMDLRPDLTIIGVDQTSLTGGERTTVLVTLVNLGTAPAIHETATVQLSIGGLHLKETRSHQTDAPLYEDIGIGQDITMIFEWTVPKNPVTLTILASVDHEYDLDPQNDMYTSSVLTKEQKEERSSSTKMLAILIVAIIIIGGIVIGIGHFYKVDTGPFGRKIPPDPHRDSRNDIEESPADTTLTKMTLGGFSAHSDERSGRPGFGPAASKSGLIMPTGGSTFPVNDVCWKCGTRLRAYTPGMIACPFCHTTTMVDTEGRFLREGLPEPEDREEPFAPHDPTEHNEQPEPMMTDPMIGDTVDDEIDEFTREGIEETGDEPVESAIREDVEATAEDGVDDTNEEEV